MSPLFKFRGNTIYPKRYTDAASLSKGGKIKKLFFGGFIPSTISPGRDAYAYDHLFVGDQFIPTQGPNFNLDLMKKQFKLQSPELPNFEFDSKLEGYAGSVASAEMAIGELKSKYADLVKENSDYAWSKEGQELYGQMSAIANSDALMQTLKNTKADQDKKLAGYRAKTVGAGRRSVILHNGSVTVFDRKTKQKSYISPGEYQASQQAEGTDPAYTIENPDGTKEPRYVPFDDESLNTYINLRQLRDEKGNIDVWQSNYHEELGSGITPDEWHKRFNDVFSNLGGSEWANKSFGGIGEYDKTLFLRDITTKGASNMGQIQDGISTMKNEIGQAGQDYILERIIENGNKLVVSDGAGKRHTKFYNFNDPRKKQEAIDDFIATEAYSRIKNEKSSFVDTREGSKDLHVRAGKDSDMKTDIVTYALENPIHKKTLKTGSGKNINYLGNQLTLSGKDDPIKEQTIDGKTVRSSVTFDNFSEGATPDGLFLPFSDGNGKPIQVDKSKTVVAKAEVNTGMVPYYRGEDGSINEIYASRPKEDFDQMQKLTDVFNAEASKLKAASTDEKDYNQKLSVLMKQFDEKYQSSPVAILPSTIYTVQTAMSEDQFDAIQEKLEKEGDDFTVFMKKVSNPDFYLRSGGTMNSGDVLVETTVTVPRLTGESTVQGSYRGRSDTKVSDAAVLRQADLKGQQHKQGGKIAIPNQIKENSFKFTPITLDDIN